jgi:alginate O-acetyltransferase complex protein AlgI
MLLTLQNPLFYLFTCFISYGFLRYLNFNYFNLFISLFSIIIIINIDLFSFYIIILGLIFIFLEFKYKITYFSVLITFILLFCCKAGLNHFINYEVNIKNYNSIPSGISFFLLSVIALIVYDMKQNIKNDLLNTFATVLFFPHILAGPVLHKPLVINENFKKVSPGFPTIIFCFGMFLLNSSDLIYKVYSNYEINIDSNSYIRSWIFYLYLYSNFMGYSLLATSYGILCNVEIPVNFNAPSLASSPSDFWLRWHRSLSLFFRNILFKYFLKLNIGHSFAIILVMILSGVWHGWGTNFILWGLINGILVFIFKYINDKKYKFIATFFIMPATWVPFYCNSLEEIIIEYKKFILINYNFNLISLKLYFIILFVLIISLLPYKYLLKVICDTNINPINPYSDHKFKYLDTNIEFIITVISGILLGLIYSYSIGTGSEFIYQRF